MVVIVAAVALHLLNASWLAPAPRGAPVLLAHRGIHQNYERTELGRDDCTATRILPPTNPYLENTLPSMRANFVAGADMLELDVHPTIDGDFAVFHDWTLDCRTDGHGVTREQRMADLRRLDVGWGYTRDGGRSFPFRGKGVGLMPSLAEVMTAFPGRRFLINYKSRDPGEADRLVANLKARGLPADRRLMVYGHEAPVNRTFVLAPEARGFTRQGVAACTRGYLLTGWLGHVPDACRHGAIAVPIGWRALAWAWPNRFLQRMRDADVLVLLIGGVTDSRSMAGITAPGQIADVPAGFDGIVWTDAIERVGPAWRRRPGAVR